MPASRTPATRRSRWPFLSLIPLGLGAWAPIYAGRRAGRPRWVAFGVLWSVAVIAGWAVAAVDKGGLGGGLMLFGWVAGAVYSFSIRREYDQITGVRAPAATAGGRRPAG